MVTIEDSANPRERPRTAMTLKMVPSEAKDSSIYTLLLPSLIENGHWMQAAYKDGVTLGKGLQEQFPKRDDS